MSNQNLLKVLFLLSSLCLSLPSFSAGKLGADMHQAKGVQCQTCHGTDMKYPLFPTEETCKSETDCAQCHNFKFGVP